MKTDLIIIGAGLAGLFAANLAVDEGLSVQVICQGRGGLSLSHGCIDILDASNPARSIKSLSGQHPYKLMPISSLQSAIHRFKQIASDGGLSYTGGTSTTIPLLSSLGIPYRTSLAPADMFKGRLDDERPIALAGIDQFRDYWVDNLAANAKRHGVNIKSTVLLPLLQTGSRRDRYAIDIASSFSDASYRDELWRAWKPKLSGFKRVGFPAIFGKEAGLFYLQEAEEYLGIEIFEIPTIPPSLPGLRLENLLLKRLVRSGVLLTEGPSALGRIDGRSSGKLAAGVQLETAGGLRSLDASYILLATGGFLHGGLRAEFDGSVNDSVFGIPVRSDLSPSNWTTRNFWEAQGYAQLGLTVDVFMRPLDQKGKPFLENLYCAGGIIGGADRTLEGSRQGIDLGTACHAIEAISQGLR